MNIRWKDLALAFFLAVGLWYMVSGSEKIDTQIDVRLDYKGIPSDMIVLDGMVNRVSVRLRATAGVARAMYGRDYLFSMDLSSVVKGVNDLPIPVRQLPFLGGVEVMDIQPSSIILTVDVIEARDVPLSLDLTTDLPPDYTVTATLDREMITVKGPSGKMVSIEGLTLPLHIDGVPKEGKSVVTKQVPLPDDLVANPANVVVSLLVEVDRKRMEFDVPVTVLDTSGNVVDLGEQQVRVVVDVPKSMATPKILEQAIKAEATLPEVFPGPSADALIPVVVRLPLSCNLVQVEPKALVFPAPVFE